MKLKIAIMLLFSQCCCFAQQHWDSLGGGLWLGAVSMYSDTVTDKLYVGGTFTVAGQDTIWGIASWSNNQWDSLGHGIDRYSPNGPNMPGSTWGMTRYGNHLYIGGNFRVAGYVYTPGFARWDGVMWDSVPNGKLSMYGVVRDIAVFNNELYICGDFDSVGTLAAKKIAKWDGATWQCVGNNYAWNGTLTKMTMYHGNLYVAGTFDDPGGNFCRLAKWDGQGWQYFTSQVTGGIADVWDMEIYNDELYVGGLFFSSAGCPATSIMRWNDTLWRDAGGSIEGGSQNPFPTVKSMCVYDGKLYCAGNFEKIGGITANYFASWDGTNWCGYNTVAGIGLNGISVYNDTLYVTGGFLELDGDSALCIAQWVGGNIPDVCGNTTGTSEIQNTSTVSVFPNPATDAVTFEIAGIQESVTIRVYDLLGKEIWYDQSVSNKAIFNTDNTPAGVYLYRIFIGDAELKTGKLIISK